MHHYNYLSFLLFLSNVLCGHTTELQNGRISTRTFLYILVSAFQLPNAFEDLVFHTESFRASVS